MRKKALLFLFCLLVMISTATSSCALPKNSMSSSSHTLPPIGSKIGNLAPGFNLVDMNGKSVSLADYDGKPVLVNFWATWCSPCRGEMPYLQQIYDDFSDDGLIMLAIDMQESPEKVKEFYSVYNLSMPALLDTSGKVSDDYGITSIPTTFFIDSEGIIQQKVIGAFPNREFIVRELSSIMQW
jgi:peroxiredoxin